jgi:FkbM family methyltransferase
LTLLSSFINMKENISIDKEANIPFKLAQSGVREQITRIIIISTYFGKWPIWFPAFLLSCAKNSTIDWIFFTDCEIPKKNYPNIKFLNMELNQLNDLASKKLGFQIQKGAYSQVDLQPAYGMIFDEYIEGYDFWGHCDIDVVWGDIRSFISEVIINNNDIVSCFKGFTAGHFTLWRNTYEVNTFFTTVQGYRDIFMCSDYHNFDEFVISTYLKDLIAKGTSNIRAYWPEQLVFWFYHGDFPNGWYWDNGKIYSSENREYIYLHFQDAKKQINHIDFGVGDHPEIFWFTRNGIQSQRPSASDIINERVKTIDFGGTINKSIRTCINFCRLIIRVIGVKNAFWARQLISYSISEKDVHYDRETDSLFLKHLNISLENHQKFLLEGYYNALQLVNQLGARFSIGVQDELFVDVAGVTVTIRGAEEVLMLKQLYLDGIYNMHFTHPAVVLDIGMDVALASIYFANHPDVVVVGCEPRKRQFDQAQYNIALNPRISNRIQTIGASISDSKFKSIVIYPPTKVSSTDIPLIDPGPYMGPKFEYEEIEIEDVVNILDYLIKEYPERIIVLKIDLTYDKYYIDGVSEYHIIYKLHSTGRLNQIDSIMLKWHKSKTGQSPQKLCLQLSEYGFQTLLFSPDNTYQGMLYAFRRCS